MECYEAPPPYIPKELKQKKIYKKKIPKQATVTIINININTQPVKRKQERYHGPVVNTPPPNPIKTSYSNLGLYDYQEQKRLIQQKHMDELLDLEAQRIYSFYKR
tara:strand:- start:2846 stop:3160 length:315 start_codon:yes stop_codon:yes gene_type:complete